MRENPYPGINAHLNSLLQTPGTPEQPAVWQSFHQQHIGDVVKWLNVALSEQFPNRYFAIGEQSLQTQELDIFNPGPSYPTRPDAVIFERAPAPSTALSSPAAAPTWEMTLAQIMEPVRDVFAAVIREVLPQGRFGRVVTRIELLSPSNKPGGTSYLAYSNKRVKALESDVPLVEIDYLHESQSPVRQLPRYPTDPQSTPYSIVVSDPRPDWQTGKVRVYGFFVGDPIKPFELPLAGDEAIVFDLNPAYQETYADLPWGMILDYRVPPERFDTYSADDQARNLDLMANVNA